MWDELKVKYDYVFKLKEEMKEAAEKEAKESETKEDKKE